MSWRDQPRDRLGRWAALLDAEYIYNSEPTNYYLDGNTSANVNPTPITDKAISSIPLVHPEGYTLDEAYTIREQHRELLKYAREHNHEHEVAFVFRDGLKDRSIVHGDATSVNMTYALNGKGHNIVVMHNHPMNKSFSDEDIIFFVSMDQVKAITVVKHNGSVEIISKTDKFTIEKAKTIINRAIKRFVKNKTDFEMDRVIRYFLTNNGGMMEWISK